MRPFLLVILLVAFVACGDSKFGPGPPDPPNVQPRELLPPTAPENLVTNIEILYNDKVRTADERVAEFANLLARPAGCDSCASFLFDFQPYDEQQHGTPDTWGRDEEILAHQNLFQAQEVGEIASLTLTIQFLPPVDLNESGRLGWNEIIATNVHLQMMFNPHDGIEVNQGQAEFKLYPAQGRWWLGEWIDRPSLATGIALVSVEPATWGMVKASYK